MAGLPFEWLETARPVKGLRPRRVYMRPSLRRSSVFKCTLGNLAGGAVAGLEGLREQLENPTANAIAKTTNLMPHAGKPVVVSQVAIVHIGNNARARSM